MFDIGFWELVMVAVIGIVVVGPNKLPEVVRTVMLYVRKFKQMFQDVKSEVERELKIDELKREIQESEMNDYIKELNKSVLETERQVKKAGHDIVDEINAQASVAEEALNNLKAHSIDPEAEKETGEELATSDKYESTGK